MGAECVFASVAGEQAAKHAALLPAVHGVCWMTSCCPSMVSPGTFRLPLHLHIPPTGMLVLQQHQRWHQTGVRPSILRVGCWRQPPISQLPACTDETSVQGDIRKVRTAILAGVGVPLIMFLSWDAAILGSLGNLQVSQLFTGSGAAYLQLAPCSRRGECGRQRQGAVQTLHSSLPMLHADRPADRAGGNSRASCS